MKMAIKLEDIIIEDLIDSDFDRKDGEAYAFICDRYKCLSTGRVGTYFHTMLNRVDWDKVNKNVMRK